MTHLQDSCHGMLYTYLVQHRRRWVIEETPAIPCEVTSLGLLWGLVGDMDIPERL